MEFNPINDLLVAQSEKPPQLGELNLRVLTPFHRALLVIDGTVTKFIEAYTMEPVEVTRLMQETHHLSENHDWLVAETGTEVIARQVFLKGKYSGKIYAYAASLIIESRLEGRFKHGLDIEGGGIGRVLINNQVESRREVLWYGKEQVNGLPEAISHLNKTDFVSRTYRIIVGEKPIMLINEKFPMDEKQLPSHI